MGQKFLEGSRKVELEENREIVLNYFLTEEYSETLEQLYYGIEIVKNEPELEELEATGGISCQRDVVEDMIRVLMECTITPISLLESVDELVTSRL